METIRDAANKFDQPNDFNSMLPDKITTKMTAKGEIQAEVRIGGELTTNKDIDELVGQHKYAWDMLKKTFPNLVRNKEVKK